MSDEVENFVGITGATHNVARDFLQMSDGDLTQAVQLYFEHPELLSTIGANSSAAPSQSAAPPSVRRAATGSSRNNAITIDSDEGDINMADSDEELNWGNDEDPEVVAIRQAQEQEDARLAQQMQDEIYKQEPMDEDGVRAPIQRITETLVAPSYGGPSQLGDDDDDEYQQRFAEMERQRRRLEQQQRARQPHRPPPSMWDRDMSVQTSIASGSQGGSSHSGRLAEMFRPPTELMCYLTWEDARDEGKDKKKWLLVNFQDMSIFDCQALNRDIWKDEDIKDLVKENFLFLQYTKGDIRATQYQTFYFHGQQVDNSDNFPHVAIVDPRTGEQVKIWSGRPFPTVRQFHAELVEFLDRYSLDPASKNPVAKTKAPQERRRIEAMTEEEMLEMALRESMATGGSANSSDGGDTATASGSGSGGNVHDPDALTRSVEAHKEEKNLTEDSEPPSKFSRISSANPHVEPPHDPAMTTRIQFKHSGGRIIRRFGVDEQVRRIFEWLKAEPLHENKADIEFELKTSPQGKNLLEMLDQSIAEAGLKQGTVMVEYLD